MMVEAAGNGRKLTYNFGPGVHGMVMSVLTQLDGKDAPVLVNGKPSGQTMGIRMIDSRHASAILKLHGKEYLTSKSEISADGKVLKVENIPVTSAGNGQVLMVEYWDKK
jgi:hypothetical protein